MGQVGGSLAQRLPLIGRSEQPEQPRIRGERNWLGGMCQQRIERIVEADADRTVLRRNGIAEADRNAALAQHEHRSADTREGVRRIAEGYGTRSRGEIARESGQAECHEDRNQGDAQGPLPARMQCGGPARREAGER